MNQLTKKLIAISILALGLFGAQSTFAQWTFKGGYLEVGVNSDGSIIDPSTSTGIRWDGTGTGAFAVNNDIITPGSPFQFYDLGYNGSFGVASYVAGSSLGATTVNTSSASAFSTLTTGSYNSLNYSQALSFGINSSVIHFSTVLTNASDTALSNVLYATGFDPDPDVYQYGSYYTINQIVSDSVVQGTGPDTGNSAIIQDLTGGATMSIVEGNWNYEYTPSDLLAGGYPGINTLMVGSIGQYDNGDYSINAAWNLGSLEPGQSVEVDYNYIINGTPVTPTSPILGGVPDLADTATLLVISLSGLMGLARRYSRR
jgi:hypothetical protein